MCSDRHTGRAQKQLQSGRYTLFRDIFPKSFIKVSGIATITLLHLIQSAFNVIPPAVRLVTEMRRLLGSMTRSLGYTRRESLVSRLQSRGRRLNICRFFRFINAAHNHHYQDSTCVLRDLRMVSNCLTFYRKKVENTVRLKMKKMHGDKKRSRRGGSNHGD